MANTLIPFRVEEAERVEALLILNQRGLDMPSYLRMCISRLVRDKGIPFRMKIGDSKESKGVSAVKHAGKIAE